MKQMPIEIIAEAGINHGGDILRALQLVDAAKEAVADTIKFQAWKTGCCYPPDHPTYSQFAEWELGWDELAILEKRARQKEIGFLCTPSDLDSLYFLHDDLRVERFKIASESGIDLELVKAIAETGKPTLLSTGIVSDQEIERINGWFADGQLTLMHCVSAYPCPPEKANLQRIVELRKFGRPVGYSDHTEGTGACKVAALLGAEMIEKHFRLPYIYCPQPDRQCSLVPTEFGLMASYCRGIPNMLGSGRFDLWEVPATIRTNMEERLKWRSEQQ